MLSFQNPVNRPYHYLISFFHLQRTLNMLRWCPKLFHRIVGKSTGYTCIHIYTGVVLLLFTYADRPEMPISVVDLK